MSTATAVPIHSELVPSQRLPILKRAAHYPADCSEDVNGIVGTSQVLQDGLRQARIVATTDSTVVIYGETGTGKELFAGLIHETQPPVRRPIHPLKLRGDPQRLA